MTNSQTFLAKFIPLYAYGIFKGEGIWNAMIPVLLETRKKESNLIEKLEALENKVYDKVEDTFT